MSRHRRLGLILFILGVSGFGCIYLYTANVEFVPCRHVNGCDDSLTGMGLGVLVVVLFLMTLGGFMQGVIGLDDEPDYPSKKDPRISRNGVFHNNLPHPDCCDAETNERNTLPAREAMDITKVRYKETLDYLADK